MTVDYRRRTIAEVVSDATSKVTDATANITGQAAKEADFSQTAVDRANAILARDKKLTRKAGFAAAPILRGAGTWLAFALAYDVATGQWAFLPWHSVKAGWDGLGDKLLGPKNWTILRHLLRGLPEGVGFGIAKSRGKNPVSKRKADKVRAREAGDDMIMDSQKPSTARRALSGAKAAPYAVGALGATFAAGWAIVNYKVGSHLGVVGSEAHVVGHAVASFTTRIGVPSTVRDAFSLSNGMENTGRVAGIASHTAGRIAGRKVRKAVYEYEVRVAMSKIEDGTIRTAGLGKQGAVAHEAAIRVTKGYQSGLAA